MTARRSRRRRRRDVAASTLPRPVPGEVALKPAVQPSTDEPRGRTRREHHATTDFRYVRSDLIGIAVVGSITLGFVIAMAIILG